MELIRFEESRWYVYLHTITMAQRKIHMMIPVQVENVIDTQALHLEINLSQNPLPCIFSWVFFVISSHTSS